MPPKRRKTQGDSDDQHTDKERKLTTSPLEAATSISTLEKLTNEWEETELKCKTAGKGAQGLKKSLHGIYFQLQLLTFFLVRGIREGYNFELATEMEDVAGKLDDVIFKYEEEINGIKQWNCRYLQAKHKQNVIKQTKRKQNVEVQIKASDLFPSEKTEGQFKGDFCLWKYFKSYCHIKNKNIGPNMKVEDLIICTNVGFDTENLKKNKIEMIKLDTNDKIFGTQGTRYKMKFINTNNDTQMKGQQKAKEKEEFFEKLVFVVGMPSDTDFDKILADEIDSLRLWGNSFQLSSINEMLVQMFKWFKEKESTWRSSADWKKHLEESMQTIATICATACSSHYQYQLIKILKFDDVKEITEKLNSWLKDEKQSDKTVYIATPSPKVTAIKIITALKNESLPELSPVLAVNNENNYLMVSSSRLTLDHEKEWIKHARLRRGGHHHVIIIWDDDSSIDIIDRFIADVRPDDQTETVTREEMKIKSKKFVIVISEQMQARLSRRINILLEDKISYTQLHQESKTSLLKKEMSFEGSNNIISMKDFIQTSDDLEKMGESTKFPLILEELLLKETQQLSFANFFPHPALPTERPRKFSRFSFKNEIIDGDTNNEVTEDHLIRDKKEMVIFGLPGSGKSTTLASLYRKIKTKNPKSCWVILIDLAKHIDVLRNNENSKENSEIKNNSIDFFVNHLVPDVQHSSFKRWLLKHRLENGSGIVLMFDDLAKINEEARVNAIHLLKGLTKTKKLNVFITAQWGNFKELQDLELADFAYELKNFEKEQQKEYLLSLRSKIVEASNNHRDYEEKILNRVLGPLQTEKFMLATPLHCEILADWVMSKSREMATSNKDLDEVTLLFDFYKHFTDITRRAIERYNNSTIKEITYSYYHNLAFQTLFSQDVSENTRKVITENFVNYTINLRSSNVVKRNAKKAAVNYGIQFGLIFQPREGSVKFFHTGLVEYTVAKYLCNGFRLDDDQEALLEIESLRKFFLEEILVGKSMEMVRKFLNIQLGLEKVVWDNKWCAMIKEASEKAFKSDQYKFIEGPDGYTEIQRLKMFVYEFNRKQKNKEEIKEYEALCNAVKEQNDSIFVLLLDCIEVMHLRKATEHKSDSGILANFQYLPRYKNRDETWKKLTKYKRDDNETKDIVERLLMLTGCNNKSPVLEGDELQDCFLYFIKNYVKQLKGEPGKENDSATKGYFFFETKKNNLDSQTILEMVFKKETDASTAKSFPPAKKMIKS